MGLVSMEECLAHLVKRCSVLGGVVLSGGEPCLYEELPHIIGEIKKFKSSDENAALSVKLDTNGMFPAMLEKLFSREETRPDYIALDLKLAPERYWELLPQNAPVSENVFSFAAALKQSAAMIRNSGIAHEYRTLALPGDFITENDIEALAPLADSAPWYFRPVRTGNCLDPAWDSLEESAAESEARVKALAEKATQQGKMGIALA